MATSGTELREALAQSLTVSDEALVVDLADGRTITVPLAWFPRLAHGTATERANWRLIAGGEGIHWPDLDEDLSVESLLAGRRSGRDSGVSSAVAPGAQDWLIRPCRRPVPGSRSPRELFGMAEALALKASGPFQEITELV